jgi:hypothetical protein
VWFELMLMFREMLMSLSMLVWGVITRALQTNAHNC